MGTELTAIVRGDGPYVSLIWLKHPYGFLGKFLSLLSKPEFLHEQHIGAALHDRKYGSLVVVADNGIHFKISKPFPVCLCRTLVYAYPAGNPEEILLSSLLFLTLPVVFAFCVPLSGGFAPPAAKANLRSVFHGFYTNITTA